MNEVKKGQHYVYKLTSPLEVEFEVVAVNDVIVELRCLNDGVVFTVTHEELPNIFKRKWLYVAKSQRWHGRTGRALGTHVFHTCPVGVWVIGRHSVDRQDNANYPHVCRIGENFFLAVYKDGEGAVAVDPNTFSGWREIKKRKKEVQGEV